MDTTNLTRKTDQHNIEIALRFAFAMTVLSSISLVITAAIWLITGTQHTQLMNLLGLSALVLAAVGVFRLLLRIGRILLGLDAMLGAMTVAFYLLPHVDPALLPAAITALLVLALAGYTILNKKMSTIFTGICILALVSMIALSFSGQTVAELAANVLLIAGLVLVGRHILLSYETTLTRESTLLRLLVDNLPNNLFVKDRESRMVIKNVAHARMLGNFTPNEVIG